VRGLLPFLCWSYLFDGGETTDCQPLVCLIRTMLKFGICVLRLFFVTHWSWVILALLFLSLAWFTTIRYSIGAINFIVTDHLSFFLILLSLWITVFMLCVSSNIWEENNHLEGFKILCLSILFFLICSFSTSNFLLFYILFEASLVPIFLMILGWGYQPERLAASYYLLFYTLLASLPLLLAIFFLDTLSGRLCFSNLSTQEWQGGLLFWTLIGAFLVKKPIYLVHLWLPKAHVEAPVAGSIILAGVLLKLGSYGVIRVFEFIYEEAIFFSEWLISLGLCGGLLASFICMGQTDIKALVAYSSVAHIAVVLVGLRTANLLGLEGALIVVVAHGLCSSGLFALVGLRYIRLSRRSLLLVRGSLCITPLLTLWWFLFSIFNMAAPPSSNLAGEIFIFISSMAWLNPSIVLIGVLSFIGAAYSLFLFSATQHGPSRDVNLFYEDRSSREHFILRGHFFFLFLRLFILLCYCSL